MTKRDYIIEYWNGDKREITDIGYDESDIRSLLDDYGVTDIVNWDKEKTFSIKIIPLKKK